MQQTLCLLWDIILFTVHWFSVSYLEGPATSVYLLPTGESNLIHVNISLPVCSVWSVCRQFRLWHVCWHLGRGYICRKPSWKVMQLTADRTCCSQSFWRYAWRPKRTALPGKASCRCSPLWLPRAHCLTSSGMNQQSHLTYTKLL